MRSEKGDGPKSQKGLPDPRLRMRLDPAEKNSRYFFLWEAAVARYFPCWTFWYFPRPTLLVFFCFAHLTATWRT